MLDLMVTSGIVRCHLGAEGHGGIVDGKQHSEIECFQRCLALNPRQAEAWLGLGFAGGGPFTCCAKKLLGLSSLARSGAILTAP